MINKFRITVKDGQTDAIRVMSSLDRSHNLTKSTDEECVIGRDDLVVIKNLADMPARIVFHGHEHDRECGRTIFRPSRQASFTLHQGKDEEVVLGPGESCAVRCEHAQDPKFAGGGVTV